MRYRVIDINTNETEVVEADSRVDNCLVFNQEKGIKKIFYPNCFKIEEIEEYETASDNYEEV